MLVGVVLAGGLSSRMGKDKAQLIRPGDSQTLLEKNCQLLASLDDCQQVWISSNKISGAIKDEYVNKGPLGAIYTCIQYSFQQQISELLILPVDMPNVRANSLEELIAMGRQSRGLACLNHGYLPMYICIKKLVEAGAIPYLKDLFVATHVTESRKHKGLSVRAFFNAFSGQSFAFADERQLINVNTPKQWQSFCQEQSLSPSYLPSRK